MCVFLMSPLPAVLLMRAARVRKKRCTHPPRPSRNAPNWIRRGFRVIWGETTSVRNHPWSR